MPERPRLLKSSDIEAAMRLSTAAGWNQTAQDWDRLLHLAPDSCFGMEVEGVLAATATLVCYGRELAWVGMVLTDSEFRRRGLGRALMERALGHATERGIGCVKLDATDMGRPLYESLGFRTERAIERWERPAGGFGSGSVAPSFEFDGTLDREAFGADRTTLLNLLASQGYGLGRPGSKAAYFGPCVALSSSAASERLRGFLARHTQEAVYWDILPDNAAAIRMAVECGFSRIRALERMMHGRDLPTNPALTWAIAGFEYG